MFPNVWSKDHVERERAQFAQARALQQDRSPSVHPPCKSCNPSDYDPEMYFGLGELHECHFNWNKKKIDELIIMPQLHVKECRLMEDVAARLFWTEVLSEVLEKRIFQISNIQDVLLSISHGTWLNHPHAHVHVTCGSRDAFESLLHTLQLQA